jgi:hypothetical protein
MTCLRRSIGTYINVDSLGLRAAVNALLLLGRTAGLRHRW